MNLVNTKRKRESLALLPLFLLLFLGPDSAFSQNTETSKTSSTPTVVEVPKPTPKKLPDFDLSQYWSEALSFFERDGDNQSHATLIDKALDQRFQDLPLMTHIFDYYLRRKDRRLLVETFRKVVEKNRCRGANESTELCLQLKSLWLTNLDSVLFYEDSAGKIEKARRFMNEKNCALAGNLLREVEARETAFARLHEMLHDVAVCLNDPGAAQARVVELQKIKFFEAN